MERCTFCEIRNDVDGNLCKKCLDIYNDRRRRNVCTYCGLPDDGKNQNDYDRTAVFEEHDACVSAGIDKTKWA